MKNIALNTVASLIILLQALPSLHAQNQTFEVSIGNNAYDIAHDAVFKPNGNLVVTGAYDVLDGNGMDAYVAELGQKGEIIWQTTLGHQFEDGGNEIVLTPDGKIFVAGHSDKTGAQICDSYCFLLSETGDTLWSRMFGFEGDDAAYGCALSNDGGFIVVGRVTIGTEPEGCILKYNVEGDLLWTKTLGFDYDSDFLHAVVSDGISGYYICGKSTEKDWGDIWLMKIDEEGNILWNKTIGSGLIDMGYSIEIAQDGGLIIAGRMTNNADFSQLYVVRTNSDGDVIWEYKFGEKEQDCAYFVSQTAVGNWIITGSLYNHLNNSVDAVLIELNDEGELNWMKFYGFDGDDLGRRVRTDMNGQILVSGCIDQSGNNDMFVMKTNANGEVYSSVFNAVDGPEPLTLYPNPCHDEIILEFQSSGEPIQLILVDLSGRVILQEYNVNTELFKINTSGFAPGLYYVQFIETETQKKMTGRFEVH